MAVVEEAVRQWIREAKKQGLSDKEIEESFNEINKKNKQIRKLFKKVFLEEEKIDKNKEIIDKLKGGFKEKMPKKDTEQYDDDFELEYEEAEAEEEEEEEEEEPKVEPKPKRRVPKVNPSYFFDHVPEKIRLLDPVKKTVIFEGPNETSLILQMNARMLQLLEEKL